MSKRYFIGVLVLVIASAISLHGAKDGEWGPDYSIENESLKVPGLGPTNPVIYDNDWWLDIVDAGFCVAQHKLGKLNLRGLIVTRDMWPNPPGYTLEDSLREFSEFRQLALKSGLTTVPDGTRGAREPLGKPDSGRIQETRFTPTAGSDLIVAEAIKASPGKPLIVIIGGAPTTMATALLQHPEIARNVVVLWLAIREYNAKDEWGSHIILMRSPVIHCNFQIRDGLTREMLQSLPDNPLCRRLKNSNLVYDNGIGDGALLAWLFDNSFIAGSEKMTITGLTGFRGTEQRPYGFLHVHNHQKRSGAIAQFMIDALRKGEVWGPNGRRTPK